MTRREFYKKFADYMSRKIELDCNQLKEMNEYYQEIAKEADSYAKKKFSKNT